MKPEPGNVEAVALRDYAETAAELPRAEPAEPARPRPAGCTRRSPKRHRTP
ncbi:hypothetical protein ACWEGE_32765 [Amycolatopsis sp. NPDC004747]